MSKFYLPFYYLIYSRLKTKTDFISWIIIWIIPQFVLTSLYVNIDLGNFIFLFIVSQVIFNSLYEIGYIENDISTTDKEEKPTLRLEKEVYIYIKKNYNKIIYFRYFIVLFFLIFLYGVEFYFHINLYIENFIGLLVLNRIFFYWHNSVRNRLNLGTFSILAITKYIFPFILFIEMDIQLFYLILFSIWLFPLLRIIEHSTHKRYKFEAYAQLIGSHDTFRIIYYFFFFSIFLILYMLFPLAFDNYVVLFLVLIYFLFYRVSSYLLLKKGLYKRDELKNKDLYIKEEN